MSKEKEQVDAYLATIDRLEPDIAMIDHGAGIVSIAISLKRIADALEMSAAISLINAGWSVDVIMPTVYSLRNTK